MTPANPRKTFVWVTLTVFAAAFGLGSLLTWLRPRTYSGEARVEMKGLAGRVETARLELEADLASSETVLNPVAESLDLNESWGRKMRVDGALKTWESVTVLKQKLTIEPIHGQNVLLVRMDYSDDSEEAAKIANAVADSYCTKAAGGLGATVSQRAQPNPQPAHPNVPLSLALEGVAGLGLALAAGAASAWLVGQLNPNPAPNAATEKTT